MSMAFPDFDTSSLRLWCEAGSDAAFVADHDLIGPVIEEFRRRPDCRILPVIDERRQVIGAIFEEDVRQILFNPYGHALLQNPGISRRLERLVRPCPMVDADAPLSVAMQAHAGGACEGVILVDAGRLVGVLLTRTLVRLAAAEEARRARFAARRMARMAAASGRFQTEAAELAGLLARAAQDIGQASVQATDRAAAATRRVAAVTEAGRHGTAEIGRLASDSHALAAAFEQLHADAAHVHAASVDAVDRVQDGAVRTGRLAVAVRSIEGMLALIESLGKRLTLLSLNATIEAARAGEAGRGFAVVAGEVRALAGQTRGAAQTISGEIRDIVTAVADVARSQESVLAVVMSVDGLVETVDGAIVAQRGITDRIAASAGSARTMAAGMVDLLDAIDVEARIVLKNAGSMERLAQALSVNAGRFGAAVHGFVADMQAA